MPNIPKKKEEAKHFKMPDFNGNLFSRVNNEQFENTRLKINWGV